MHHTISDGWSLTLLLNELQESYRANLNGGERVVNRPARRYVDYAVWQQSWMRDEVLERNLRYWKAQLEDIPPLLDLPTDYPRPAIQTFRGNRESLKVSDAVTRRFRELCRKEEASIFMGVLAVFQVLLQRHTGMDDIVVGTPTSGRQNIETESIIGCFINTLVLRTRLSPNRSFRTLIRDVRETVLDAFAHEDFPFEKLVEALQPERDLSHTPLVQILINQTEIDDEPFALEGLETEKSAALQVQSKFDLTLYFKASGESLVFDLVYNADLFAASRIEEFLQQFDSLIGKVVKNPDASTSEFSLVTPEALRILPDPASPIRERKVETVLDRIESCTARNPEHPAVRHGNRTHSYSDLFNQAAAIASNLRKVGVGRGDVVAVTGRRCYGMICAIVGVLLSGGILLTLDRRLPLARRKQMLDISQAKGEITVAAREDSPGNDSDLTASFRARVEADSGHIIDGESRGKDFANPSGDDPAYLFFTSGSTGVPKAVLGTHKGLAHFLDWQREEIQAVPGDRIAQLTGLSFDVVLRDIFLPLTSGATLCIPGDAEDLSSGNILSWLASERITLLHSVPSLAQAWLADHSPDTASSSLRAVFFAGEPLTDTLVYQWRRAFPECTRVINLYGPTETTLAKCFYEVPEKPPPGVQPIGRPLPDTQILVLNWEGVRCGLGEKGQIAIRTPFRTQGYLRDPVLTQEKFRRNPESEDIDDLIYYTGDYGRYDLDGTIAIYGRVDRQIKVRGMRVELDEIESLLSGHASIQQCAVLPFEIKGSASSETVLELGIVAYVYPANRQPQLRGNLRKFLAAQLPDYMVPSIFVVLDEIPLTPNGKIDRKALPDPEKESEKEGNVYVKPGTWEENTLAGIWEKLLGRSRIGIDESFFEVGGHSLLAIRVISRIRKEFNVELSIRAIFESPSIRDLSRKIVEQQRSGGTRRLPPIESTPDSTHFPLSFCQRRLWFLHRMEPNSSVYNIRQTFRLRGGLDIDALRKSINELTATHESLRTTFTLVEGEPYQRIQPDLMTDLRVLEVQGASHETRLAEANRLLGRLSLTPFDLDQGPLFRTTLLEVGPRSYFLLLEMHHTISDGWSLTLLLNELQESYRANLNGGEWVVNRPARRYVDYAVWQQSWMRDEVLERNLRYWKAQLEDIPPLLDLPTDYPRPAIQTFRGYRESLKVSDAVTRRFRELCRKEEASIFMGVLAVFQILLQRHTGMDDIVVGTPTSGRQNIETESIIGCFINTLVLRTRLSSDQSFRTLLGDVKETVLNAFAHEDMPFEKLVEALQPERDLSHTPLVQILINQTEIDDEPFALEGLETEKSAASQVQSKFDLTLYFKASGESLVFDLVYNADLFAAARMEDFIRQFDSLMGQVVDNPDGLMLSFQLVTPMALRILPDLASPIRERRVETVLNRIESCTARNPEHPAVRHGNRTHSYSDLFNQAAAIASHLRKVGVGRGDFVAITGRRSYGMICAIVGVLLSGGVLLTLDRRLPLARRKQMLDISQAKGLITVAAREDWPENDLDLTASFRGRVEADSGQIVDGASGQEDFAILSGDDPAYLFFSSGSTGVPKAILGTHKGLAHFLEWQREEIQTVGGDRIAQLTGLSFDVVLRDIFLPLTSGATLCIPGDAEDLSSGSILSWLASERITLLHSVPSLAQAWFADASPKEISSSLRAVFFAGEPLTDTLVYQWRRAFPECARVINLYGPTETTLAKCFYEVPEKPRRGVQPIGRPLPDTQILILNRDGVKCGLGEKGEIAIRTPFRSQGYFRDPVLTQEKFRHNPSSEDSDDLIYLTGDYGRYDLDGTIAIYGRVDRQIKVRGMRVELDEVESQLSSHGSVQQCAVLPFEVKGSASSRTGLELRIVAYVCPTNRQPQLRGNLRRFLATQLPDYMIPSIFVVLDELPLTPNGKIDRKALPDPEKESEKEDRVYVKPSNTEERTLAGIWEKLLGRSRIGIDENFFEIGGHSLLGIRLIAEIERKFGEQLDPTTLFLYPTIAQLGAILRNDETEVAESPIVTLQPLGERPSLICIYFVFYYQRLAELLGPDIPVDAIVLPQEQKFPHHSIAGVKITGIPPIEVLASRYVEQILEIQPHGPYYLAGFSFSGVIAFEIAQQLRSRGEKVALLVLFDSYLATAVKIHHIRRGIHLMKRMTDSGLRHIFQAIRRRVLHYQRRIADRRQRRKVTDQDERLRTTAPMPSCPSLSITRGEAKRRYQFAPYQGRTVLFRAIDQIAMRKAGMEFIDPSYGWDSFISNGLEVYDIPGSHADFLGDPHVSQVSTILRRCFEDARGKSST